MSPHQSIASFFGRWPRRAIQQPGLALFVAAAVTLIAAPGIFRLQFRTDGHALVSPDAAEVQADAKIRSQFGIEDEIVVLIRAAHTNGIFNSATLQRVRDLTADFQKLPGLNPSNVISLATDPSFHLHPGSINPLRLLEPPLKAQTELQQLRDDLRQIRLYTGTLVSLDGQSTAILIGTPTDCDRAKLYEKLNGIIAARRNGPDRIALTGAPVAESLLGIHILEDLGVPPSLLGSAGGATRNEDGRWRMEDGGSAHANSILHPPSSILAVLKKPGLVPVTILVMMAVLLAAFRNPLAALVPLPGIAATLVSVFGFMGWAGTPVYLTIIVMPVLLVVTGVTNDIYLFTRYFNLLRENPGTDRKQLLGETFEKLSFAVAVTSLATAIGFFSFIFSPIGPVRAFGIWAGFGALLGLFFSLTLVPAILSFIPSAWLLSRKKNSRAPLADFFSTLGLAMVRRRALAIAGVIAVVALMPFGLRRLTVQDSWTDSFDPDSEFRRATETVNRDFFGMHQLFIGVSVPKLAAGELSRAPDGQSRLLLPGNVCDELAEIESSAITLSATPTNATASRAWRSQLELLHRTGTNISAWIMPAPGGDDFLSDVDPQKIHFEIVVRTQLKPAMVEMHRALAEFVRGQTNCAVGGVLGPFEYLTTTRFMSQGGNPAMRELLPIAGENRTLWNYYAFALGQNRFHQVMDTNYWQSLTTVFLKDANFQDTARLLRAIREYAEKNLATNGIQISFAGDVAVSQSLIGGIVSTQLRSLAWSLLGIFCVTALLGGSLRWGIFCLLPSLLAVIIKFAVMGWADIPLGVATSMFAAMTLGIGVNCAIHLLEGFEQARAAGKNSYDALNQSLRLTGPPALVNTVAMSLGFGVLMLSQVPANARLGMLLVLGLVNCFVVSVLLLPALLAREGKS